MANVSKRWLLIARSVTLLSLMVILAPLLISDVLEFQNYYGHFVRLILPSPIWASYFVILWNLRAAVCSDTKRVKKSLALAISWGAPSSCSRAGLHASKIGEAFVLPHNASFESKSVGSLRTIVAA